jgi:hypothetical protein
MRTTKNTTEQKSIEKEVKGENVSENINFLDRHIFNWFIDTEINELKIGKNFSDFLNKKSENFSIKKIHSCDVKFWKLVETTDGKFVLLSRTKILK